MRGIDVHDDWFAIVRSRPGFMEWIESNDLDDFCRIEALDEGLTRWRGLRLARPVVIVNDEIAHVDVGEIATSPADPYWVTTLKPREAQ